MSGYLSRAVVEAAVVGALCGAVGVHVVLRRLSFFTMAMTHATFPGVVLAAILGLNLYLGGGAFGVLAVLAVAWLSNRPGSEATTAVGVVLSTGFALGVALMSARDGFTRDLSAYLVGSVLTVSGSDVAVATGVTVAVLAVLLVLRKELLFGAFDREAALAVGYRAALLDVVLLVVVEVTVVTAVPAVGTILAVALLVAPAATARLWCGDVRAMTAVSMALGAASGVAGVVLSGRTDVAAGAAVVLVACAAFAASLVAVPYLRRAPLTGPPADPDTPADPGADPGGVGIVVAGEER